MRAIRAGEVDALVVSGAEGEQLYTLQGADHSYRILLETMEEGAATLGARMAQFCIATGGWQPCSETPLNKVMGFFL